MKATILLMFLLFIFNGHLLGQEGKFNYIDSEINKPILPITDSISSQLRKPNIRLPKKNDIPTIRNLDRFWLIQDSSSIKNYNVRLYSDFVVVEEVPVASRFYGYSFVRKPDSRGKILVIKPDTSSNVKYHLIIKDPIHHTITK